MQRLVEENAVTELILVQFYFSGKHDMIINPATNGNLSPVKSVVKAYEEVADLSPEASIIEMS